jgi:nucleoside phosphorylase
MRKVVILTALRVEYLAVREHLQSIKEVHHPEGNFYETGIFQGEGDDNTWEVVIAEIGPENENAAVQTERAIRFFDPGIILLVGVAGGFKTKDVTPGDVVVASKVYGYESGKAEANDFKTRPEVFRPGFKLLDALVLKEKKVFIVNGLAGIGKSILISKLLQHEANPYPQGDFFSSIAGLTKPSPIYSSTARLSKPHLLSFKRWEQ